MTLTRLSLSNTVATSVAVMLLVLFGLIGLNRLPIQLTPEVEKPEIKITTTWRAAAPEEVEAEIIEPQEKVLRGLPGMTEMLSNAQRGRGEITITFTVDTDLQRGLLDVLNRLNRVARYPEDADEPVLSTVGGDSRPIAWFIIKPLAGNERDIASYQNFIEEVVQTRFERVPGVALSEVRGGRDREVRITFDPYKAATLGIELPAAAQLAGGNDNVSGGEAFVGKRRYTLRYQGKFETEDIGNLVLAWREGRPVYLRDLATVELRMVDRKSFVVTGGEAAIAVNAHRETGVNVLDTMDGLQEAMQELRDGSLKQAGLSIEQVFDETIYIDRAVLMLANNLALGIALAVSILWWFMRSWRATLMVAMAIPFSLLATFFVLDIAGRTLNIISFAGLAFAVGMVLDAAIVVLENIVRLREQGKSTQDAALEGPGQVWGALLASTATTVAIFAPIVFLEDEAGQLFADLALAIAVAITVSLIIALTVVPAAAKTWLAGASLRDRHHVWWAGMTNGIMRLTSSPGKRTVWIVTLLSVPLLLAIWLLPKADYLPEGNRNLVFAFILPPPGANIDFIREEMGAEISRRLKPYLSGEKQPQIKHYFFVAFPQGVFMGTRAVDDAQVGDMVRVVNEVIGGFPDTLAFAKRASLFGGFASGRTIDMNFQSKDIDTLLGAAGRGFGLINQALPGASVRPYPGLELAEPELRLQPNDRRLAEAGWNRGTMAQVSRALGEGLYVGDYFDGEEQLNIIVRVQPWATPEELGSIPLATPLAGILPVNELVQVLRTSGPDTIRRLDRRRTVTLQITPPEGLSLEEALNTLQTQVEPKLISMLPEDGDIRYSGTADKLKTAISSMSGSFLLAVVILYLLISALFRSFKDSLLVMLVLPLAAVGGVIGLQLLNGVVFQPLDLLTMIGFIILLGLVVNNAILLVHLARQGERAGMDRRSSVEQAVRLRLRPILMSTLTSLFGMLPLVLIPGAGTELYRGLATVIVGGMSVSTVFTLVLLPSLLRIGEETFKRPDSVASVP